MTHWEYFPPSHPTAIRLYEYAQAWVQVSHPLDTYHIVCAALSPQAPDIPVSGLIAQIVAPAAREHWLKLMVAELRVQAGGFPLSRQPSPILLQCLELWRQRSVDPSQPITDVVMVATVIGMDQRVQRIMESCGISFQPFMQSLWQLSGQPAIPGFSQSGSFPVYLPDPFGGPITGPHPAIGHGVVTGGPVSTTGPRPALPPTPFGLPAAASQWLFFAATVGQQGGAGDDEAIRAEIARLVRFVEPSRGRSYAKLHAFDVNVFLDLLAESRQYGRVPVIAGRAGTHASNLPQLIADRIAQSCVFEGKQAVLNIYRGLFKLDVAELCDLAAMPGKPDPQKVLGAVLREFAGSCWLLLVDHVEVLYNGSKLSDGLRDLLFGRFDAPVFGRFHLAGDEAFAALAARFGPKVALAVTPPTRADETSELIWRYFLPQWEMDGFTFTRDAFGGLLALEPGIVTGGYRTALPYLAIEIAEDAVQTVRDGDTSIRTAARRAISAIEALKPRDRLCFRDDARRPYEKVLLEAQREIQQIIEKPLPEQRNGRRVLTRAHITAQLLGGGRAEFRYPQVR